MSTMEEDRIPENVLFSPLSTSSTHTDSYSQYDQPLPPRFYDRYFSSSSDDESDNHKLTFDSKKLDYMMQFLDRKLSSSTPASNSQHNRGLPEFIAKGGGTGIFQLPLRAAVHPSRPPSLELRPRPLRETQVGCSLKNLVSTSSQLWAGTDCGLRVWEFRDLYGARSSGEVGTGDEETAPFKESVRNIAVNCVVGDEGNGVVWSGHNDGRIRCWKMQQNGSGFKEDLSWQAHSGPVLSVIITSYGDLWSGSESGIIMIWPREASEKAFSLSMEERQLAALLMERSCVDLRSQISFSNMFTSDIKYLLSDNSRAKVWSAGYLSFALWDARTKELLKVFNVDGQIENRIDMSSVQDHAIEDDVKMRITFNLKKEKSQSSISFLQRSRNAIIGAADAVRRAAVKGAFGDDNRRTEALVISMDGMIWAGCANGLLVRWDGNGNRLQEFQYHSFAVQCFCTFGSRIWVGYASGTVQVIDIEGNLLGGWQAHGSPVISMAVGAGYIFTLANQGGVRGWIITSPAPLDFILRSELACKEFLYTRLEKLKILTGTWNVGQGRPSHDSLLSWLFYGAADADLVVVGLQEVEMGAGFLAMSAAKETVGLEGSSVGQLWLDMIGNALGEGPKFERISSRQLAGLLISVWVKIDIKDYVGDVDAAAVPCGFGRAIGNKGAVGLRMRVYGRKMCFVNCHFAAHLEAVNRRNADFDHVYRTMTFSRPSNFLNTAAAGVSSAVQMLRGTNAMSAQSMEELPDLSEADMVVFLGDFNYRLCDISYDEARDFISQRCFDWLREKDQLRAQMEAGNVCQGMREAVILFPPTYKFERHRAGLTGYDSGERKRTPAWCDRILYRDSRAALESDCSLQYPVVSSILQYEACMDVTDSDHKPVRCVFSVEIARVDESVRRQEYGEIIGSNKKAQSLLKELSSVPEIIISTNNIILQNSETFVLRITNRSERNDALFEIVASRGQSAFKKNGRASDSLLRVSHGFPRWLKVSPALGIIRPDQIMEVSVHHAESQTPEEFVDGIAQNWWIEESREKEVILVVKVRGALSTASKDHRVRVCQCLSTKSTRRDSEPTGNLLRHSDIQKLSGSYEVVDHFKNLHSP